MSRKGLNIYKRKDGRWEGRYSTGKMINGRKKYISVYGRSYSETKEKLISIIGESKCTETLTFQSCAADWLKYAELRVKPSTYANYRFLLSRHILPFFGRHRMQKLSPANVEAFITQKLSSGKLKSSSGLSKKYLKDIVSIIKQIASYAERKYDIQNSIRYVVSPKSDKKEVCILDESDKQKLAAALFASNNSMDIGILISLYTGMRIGEICGLKWKDINLQNKTICVRHTVQRICDGMGGSKIIIGTPKTKNSFRTIPIPNILFNKLVCVTSSITDPCKTVISELNEFAEPRELRNRFYKVLKQCQIKHSRFHILRHSFASECVKLGFDIKALSEILGHSNASMTLDRYVHSSLDIQRMYMERFV